MNEDLQAPELDQPVLELQAGQEAATTRQQQAGAGGGAVTPITSGGTGSSTAAGALANLGAAPSNAQYVVIALSGGLSVERVLTGTANQITITDNGAGGTVVISLPATITVATAYQVAGTQVVSARGAAVADAAGGATVDAEARTAINDLLARVRTHGLIAP